MRKLVKDLSTHLNRDVNFGGQNLTFFPDLSFQQLPEITAPVVGISIISWQRHVVDSNE